MSFITIQCEQEASQHCVARNQEGEFMRHNCPSWDSIVFCTFWSV